MKHWLLVGAIAAAIFASPKQADAQAFPQKNVTIIVPFGAGGIRIHSRALSPNRCRNRSAVR